MNSDERVIELLEQQLAWTRVMAIPQAKAAIVAALRTEAERRAYEASDGTKTTREIAAVQGVGTSHTTIANWWKKWRALGIASEVEGRKACHLISLADLGIPLKPHEDNGS